MHAKDETRRTWWRLPPVRVAAWTYYASFYQGSWGSLALSASVSVIQSLLVLPIALVVRYALDTAIPAGDTLHLGLAGGALLLLYLANSGATIWTRRVTLEATQSAVKRFRGALLDKWHSLPRSCYSEADRSKLHASIVQDTHRLDVMSNALVAVMLPALAVSATLSAVLLFLSWRLFLVIIGFAPLVYLASRTVGEAVRRRAGLFRRAFEAFSERVLFVLQKTDLIRTQSAERWEIARQEHYLEELRVASGAMAWLRAVYASTQNTILTAAAVTMLFAGGVAVSRGSMTLGELAAFYLGVRLLSGHLSTVATQVPQVIVGHESLNTLFDVIQIEETRPYSGRRRIPFGGRVTLEAVHFGYQDRRVLRGVDLTLRPGTITAVVGPNGSGKTTLAYLILGFYRPQQGTLYADDHPYDELDITDLRRQFGVASQDPVVFPGTIWENITFGCPDATLAQVVEAAELATAHEFVEELPEGYDTFVGESGLLLSGGQRQRLALARAFLRQPKLLILDEPTTHLDEAAVDRLMAYLHRTSDVRAVLLISHDFDVASRADVIHVLREGRVVSSESAPTGGSRCQGEVSVSETG
jgi:ABC-type multidrug transport system fused ATPase/permease subunit